MEWGNLGRPSRSRISMALQELIRLREFYASDWFCMYLVCSTAWLEVCMWVFVSVCGGGWLGVCMCMIRTWIECSLLRISEILFQGGVRVMWWDTNDFWSFTSPTRGMWNLGFRYIATSTLRYDRVHGILLLAEELDATVRRIIPPCLLLNYLYRYSLDFNFFYHIAWTTANVFCSIIEFESILSSCIRPWRASSWRRTFR